ncbi:hypothetical protein DL98DRAFT_537623 [Cadophora sp. DSE1049]|nr:hypothetical protein DL98DRAFT_537623 [Cadophora sp. DSE1049]
MAGTSDTKKESQGPSENPPPYQPDLSAAIPARPSSEGSSTEKSTPPSRSKSRTDGSDKSDNSDDGEEGVLVFVEAVVQDKKSNLVSANVFQNQGTGKLYSYDEYVNGRCGSKEGDLHVACINPASGYRELLQDVLEGISRNEPKYITAKKWKPLKIDVWTITVLWDGMESGYSDDSCKTTMTLKTDGQIQMVLAKMEERGWKDRFVVEFKIAE